MKLMSIDGSINDIGVALIDDGKYVESYTYHSKSTDTKEVKLTKIADHFYRFSFACDFAVIELPEAFVRFGKYGIKNFMSLQSLHMAIGAIIGAIGLQSIKVAFMTPREWKNRGSKLMTQMIVKQLTGKSFNTHEADAIMMGLTFWKKYQFRYRAMKNV